ncbi:MAG: SDR family oxidoreductase [Pseudomonadota bacterium]
MKCAVVTGAARGIGLETARHFMAEGWAVALLDIDGPAQIEAAEELDAKDRVLALTCDVAVDAEVDAAFRAIAERFGRVDALVNNAGTAVFKPLGETTAAEWRRVIDVNLTGPFLCTQAAVPLMVDGGAVVNIASISGQRASTLRVAYGTSKAGVMHLTKQQAVELGEKGVRVNCVAPGPVDTAMAKAVHSDAIRRDYGDHIPLARYGLEREIAEAILFLCSDKASYVTGQVLSVDGGFEAAGIGLPILRGDPD